MEETFRFFGLGGCNEVGRSCHIIEYKNKVIMLDAGIHPALSGHSSFPFYDEYDLSKVDVLLISHFHLDHAASLPYVMQHTNFKGRVYMTHATKAIYRWLLQDFVRVTSIENDSLYSDEDIKSSFDNIISIDFHSTIEFQGIKFTPYHAGHVLGSCMYFIEIGGLKILFTGDYSRTENRHLISAEVPQKSPDILITESTFGTGTLAPRLELEKKLTSSIHATLLKGGRVLMPVFALGNAQELLLILDEYWSQHPDLHNISIFFASSLAKKCMAVYQTYTNIMNDNIRLNSHSKSSPFDFKFVKSIKDLSRFQDMGPSVFIASPGMLQAGVSRQLLEKWAPDQKNLCIMTGYSVEGTMAKELLKEPTTIQSINNSELSIPRRITIDEISFAAHVDFQENSQFIDLVSPSKIILVHGDSVPMGRLKSALLSKYSARKGTDDEIKVFNPKNCEYVDIPFNGLKIAKVLGILAEQQLELLKETVVDSPKIEDLMEVEENDNVTKHDEPVIKEEGEVLKKEGESSAEEVIVKKEDEESPKSVSTTPSIQSDKSAKSETETTPTADSIKSEVEVKPESTKDDESSYLTGQVISGVLVSKDFDLNLLQLQDLHEFTQLSTSIVKSKINLKINADISLMRWHLEQMFGYINIVNDDEEEWECLIMESIDVLVDRTKKGAMYITVEWINDNLMADTLADSVIAILYSIDSSPASIKLTSNPCGHAHKEPEQAKDTAIISGRIHRVLALLKAQFGNSLTENGDKASIVIGKNEAKIDFIDLSVECGSKVLKDRVENVIKRGLSLAAPLARKV